MRGDVKIQHRVLRSCESVGFLLYFWFDSWRLRLAFLMRVDAIIGISNAVRLSKGETA